MRKQTPILTTIFLLATWAAQAQAATWYVAPNGNDGNSCSSAAPCASINGAYQKASGGDVIQLAAGTYGDQTIGASGKSSDVVARPASGATVTMGKVNFNGTTHLELQNVTISEWDVQMNSKYITLRNVTIKGGLFFMGGSNISMIGGSVGPGVDYHPQIAPGNSNGWQGQGQNILFDGVLFHDWTRTNDSVHTECLQVAGSTNMVIRNSKFTNCAVFDLSFTEYNGSGKVTNLTLENNWFDTAIGGYYAVNLSQYSGGVSRFNSSTQAWVIQGTNPAPMTFAGNIVVDGIRGSSGPCSSSAEAIYAYNITQGNKCGATDKDADPGFVNAAGFDLHLKAGSPAIDFVPTTLSAIASALLPGATDIDGLPRLVGSALDAGASEYGSSGVSSSTKPNPPTGLQVVVQ